MNKTTTEDLGKCHTESGCLLKLMSVPELYKKFTVNGVQCCEHISCVKSDQVLVSDAIHFCMANANNQSFTIKIDDICENVLHNVGTGSHTVKSKNEFFFIDRHYNIQLLATNTQTITLFMKNKEPQWIPWCLYWSKTTKDLLVGMYRQNLKIGKVKKYSKTGKLIKIIQHDVSGLELYCIPNYITVNHNEDIVVSAYGTRLHSAVVVTDREGGHRFSYTGHPPKSGLEPRGICTDVLSNILVCDDSTLKVHILDKNGRFLSHLFMNPSLVFEPRSLGYDFNTHRLWIGSRFNNDVCIYNYITRQEPSNGMFD